VAFYYWPGALGDLWISKPLAFIASRLKGNNFNQGLVRQGTHNILCGMGARRLTEKLSAAGNFMCELHCSVGFRARPSAAGERHHDSQGADGHQVEHYSMCHTRFPTLFRSVKSLPGRLLQRPMELGRSTLDFAVGQAGGSRNRSADGATRPDRSGACCR
jgi:hypothetical protein